MWHQQMSQCAFHFTVKMVRYLKNLSTFILKLARLKSKNSILLNRLCNKIGLIYFNFGLVGIYLRKCEYLRVVNNQVERSPNHGW